MEYCIAFATTNQGHYPLKMWCYSRNYGKMPCLAGTCSYGLQLQFLLDTMVSRIWQNNKKQFTVNR